MWGEERGLHTKSRNKLESFDMFTKGLPKHENENGARSVKRVPNYKYKGIEGSLTHTPVAEGELYLASGNYEEIDRYYE